MSRADLKILYEDRNLIAVFKNTGVHSNSVEVARGASRYLPLHRLDFDTQGLLLLAQEAVWKDYHALFLQTAITKQYLAGASSKIELAGLYNGFIGSRYRSSKKTIFMFDQKKLRSYHSVLEAAHSIETSKVEIPFKGLLFEVTLQTGRRHQIRSFFAAMEAPLLGDTLYGDSSGQKTLELFSWKLSFIDPLNDGIKKIEIEAPPALFQRDE